MEDQTAKLFQNGGSQAVRLPREYSFAGSAVYIRRSPEGDVVLSTRPTSWAGFFESAQKVTLPDSFLPKHGKDAAP